MNSTSVFHFFIGVSVEQQMNYAESADINSASIGNYCCLKKITPPEKNSVTATNFDSDCLLECGLPLSVS